LAKAAPKLVCSANGNACITITDMALQQDITVTITPYHALFNIPDAPAITALLGTTKTSQIIGGADVYITNTKSQSVTSKWAKFEALVAPSLTEAADMSFGGISYADMLSALGNNSGKVYLCYYADTTWHMAGEGVISESNGVYSVKPMPGVRLNHLYPYLYLYCAPGLSWQDIKVDAVSPNQGFLGKSLPVTVKGGGYDPLTRASMKIDMDNAQSLIGSLALPGWISDVAVNDTRALVAGEDGLQMVDISNPAKPAIIAALTTAGGANVAVAGNKAIVAVATALFTGLQVVDINNPALPAMVGSVATPDWETQDITLKGDQALVAAGYNGLQVVDISNPAQPKIMGSVDTPGFAHGVTVAADDMVLVADGDSGLQVIDISNPAKPVLIGSADTPDSANAVSLLGSTAIVADGQSGLQMVDISNPTQPTIINSVLTPNYAENVALFGANILVTGSNFEESWLTVIDYSKPTSPRMAQVKTAGSSSRLAVTSDKVLVVDGENGLQVVDLGAQLTWNSTIIDTPGNASQVAISNHIALVADGDNGIQVINLGNDATPQLIASADTPGTALGVAASGDTALVADGASGLQVIDISNPIQPVIIGSEDTPGSAHGVAVADDKVLVADGTSGLQVIDISDPSHPVIIGSADTPGVAGAVSVHGTIALVADGNSGLQVIDISNPAKPKIIGTLVFTGSVSAVAITDNTALVATGKNGLKVVDISNPAKPKKIGSTLMLWGADGVAVHGTTAYVTGYGGLQLVDISNPFAPRLNDYLATPAPARNVTVAGHAIFTAAGESGVITSPIFEEITPITVNTATSLNLTLPPSLLSGNYTLRLFNIHGQATGTVNISAFDFSKIDPNMLALQTDKGELPPTSLTINDSANLQLIYKTKDGTPINLSALGGQEPVEWLSGNPGVVAVNINGVVSAKAAGHALISAKVPGGGKAISIQVTSPAPIETAKEYGNLIVVAGRNAVDEELGQTFQALANMAYETFYKRNLGHDDITYINAYGPQSIPGWTGDVVDTLLDTNVTNGSAVVTNAINTWAKDKNNTGPLYLYMVDHGGKQALKVTPKSILTAAQVKAALDQFQAQTGRDVVVMIEACYSGTWKEPLTAPNRLVMTSTGEMAELLPNEGVANTFSDYLFKGFAKGKTIEKAYTYAVTGVQSTAMGKNQSPWSAVGDTGLWASYVVGPWASAASFALFADYTGVDGPLHTETGKGLTLSSTLDIVNEEWVEAYAILTPPTPAVTVANEFETPALVQIKVPLSYQGEVGAKDYFGSGKKVFGGVSAPLPMAGEWELSYYVKDQNGELTASSPVAVTVSGDGTVTTNETLSLAVGWNLMGTRTAIDVANTFADSGSFTSLWKWESGTWAVRLPGDDDAGAAYAAGKNFLFLNAIAPGEGFWVNSKQAKEVILAGTPVFDGPTTLVKGWNLVSLKSGTPKDVATLVADEAMAGAASLWKWGNGTWSVYLPGEVTPGAYAQGKGFAVLGTIYPGEGFWVNMP
jgi:hypothetical protein